MNRTILGVTFVACATAWACSSGEPASTPAATDAPTTLPAEETGLGETPAPDPSEADDGGSGGAQDAASSDRNDGGKKSDSGPTPDAAPDAGPGGCVNETEPNDGSAQQLPRSLCGTVAAGDVDRFFVEGRQDEPIEVIFSADGDALVTFATNAGLKEAFFAKSFKTTVKPGDRKLFIEVGMAKASVAYHLAFERK